MRAFRTRPRARRTALFVPPALGIVAAALFLGGPGGPPPGTAVDRYRAGEPAATRTSLPPAAEERARARGLAHARALGMPLGRGSSVMHVVDRFAGTALDEVVSTDVRGRRVGIIRLRPDGRLAMAVRLGWHAAGGAGIDEGRAVAGARALAAAAGLATAGEPVVGRAADGGWRVAWPRTTSGIPVPGDGTEVTLFADGTFHGAASRERTLAAAPASLLDRAAAETLAGHRLGALLGASAPLARIVGMRLAWVAPNDTFDSSAPDAPDPVLRLAWVAEARTVAPLADSLRALELYLDAGSGALLGGDLLR
jgi:hypothetical protein